MYAVRWARLAALFFLVGSSVGLYAGITQQFELATGHAHVNLLGWVSMALMAALYRLFPSMESDRLAGVHFWLYLLSYLFFPGSLVAMGFGWAGAGAVLPAAASLMLLSVLLTTVLIWRNAKA